MAESNRHSRGQNPRDARYDIPGVQRAHGQQYIQEPTFYANSNPASAASFRQDPPVRRAAGKKQPRRRSPGKKKNPLRRIILWLVFITVCLSVALILNTNWKTGCSVIPDTTSATAAGTSGTGSPAGENTADASSGGNTSYTEAIVFSSDTAKPLYGKVIILDPGHGGSDSGCIYPAANPTLYESRINLLIAQKTKAYLEAQGATVILLRTDDSWISLYRRVSLAHLYCLQYADQLGINTIDTEDKDRLISELIDSIVVNSDTADNGGMGIMAGTGVGSELSLLMDMESNLTDVMYLSIHTNSNEYTSLHGTQVYYVTDDSIIASEEDLPTEEPEYANDPSFPLRDEYYGRNGDRNALLAEILYDAITASAPQMETNAESTWSDNYAVLREHNLTGALIEVGFLSNKTDRANLSDADTLDQIAAGIADGCVNFFASGS